MTVDASSKNDNSGAAGLLERVIVVASVLLILGTLGYIAWQAAGTSTTADPIAIVEAVEPTSSGERLHVAVRLDNRRGTGLTSVQVAVRCGVTERSLEFTHVPAGGHRTGSVVCPAGTTPEAVVETWIEA